MIISTGTLYLPNNDRNRSHKHFVVYTFTIFKVTISVVVYLCTYDLVCMYTLCCSRIVDDDATLSQITDAVLAVYASQGLADFTATLAFVETFNNVGRFGGSGIVSLTYFVQNIHTFSMFYITVSSNRDFYI